MNDNVSGGKRKGKGLVSVETITPKTIIKHPSMLNNNVNEYHHTTKSTLTIKNATPNDAGNYTCKPSNAVEASIQVFVSEGKGFYNLLRITICKGKMLSFHFENLNKKYYHCIFLILDRQSEPLLRPDAKDHSSSIFHQLDTHRTPSSSNQAKDNKGNSFSKTMVGFQDSSSFSSSSSSFPFLLPWFKNIKVLVVKLFVVWASMKFV